MFSDSDQTDLEGEEEASCKKKESEEKEAVFEATIPCTDGESKRRQCTLSLLVFVLGDGCGDVLVVVLLVMVVVLPMLLFSPLPL